LVRTPGVTLVVVLSLGVGIGAATTAYTWIDAFVLRPLPLVERSDRLVSVYTKGPSGARWSLSYPAFTDWRAALPASVFEGITVSSNQTFSLKTDRFGPERVWGQAVSGNFFDLLGVRVLHGRPFQPDEERQAAPVAVISEQLWTRAFGRDPGAIGSQVSLNGQGFTIVGVTPTKFGGTLMGLGFDLWVPVTTIAILDPGNTSLTERGWQWLQGFARRKPGISLAQAEAALTDASRKVGQSLGEWEPTLAGAQSLSQDGGGPFVVPLLFTVFALAIVILAIACANITNILLVRATRRTTEISLRLAIGASRWQIVKQLLTESLLLSAAGGALGLLLAQWGRKLFAAALPPLPFPIRLEAEINWRVVAVTALGSILTAVLAGLAPALRFSRPSLVGAIKGEALPGSSRSWLRSGLVVGQVAMSLIALVIAGLFGRSLLAARAADPGFARPDGLLVAGSSVRLAGLADSAGRIVLERIFERVRTIPGVVSVTSTTDPPMQIGNNSSSGIELEGYQPGPDENMSILRATVGPDYFATMEIPLLAGRGITVDDRAEAPPVAVASRAFAKRFFGEADPIGRRFRYSSDSPWITIVGMAADVTLERAGETPPAYLYYPLFQRFEGQFFLIVRTAIDPKAVIEPLRATLLSIDANLPLLDPMTMRESMLGATFMQQAGANLLGGLGFIALGLAAIGLYGVLAYSVTQRNKEIGIRVALGAATGKVVRLVGRQAAVLVGLGVGLGGALALAAARLLGGQLVGVTPTDPLTYGAVIGILMVVGFAAAILPARRAARVDPVTVLRE
jgi:predicted permease